jgi:hypothetical protein
LIGDRFGVTGEGGDESHDRCDAMGDS